MKDETTFTCNSWFFIFIFVKSLVDFNTEFTMFLYYALSQIFKYVLIKPNKTTTSQQTCGLLLKMSGDLTLFHSLVK